MEALLGLIALIVVALVGWAIAEFKYKAFTFTRSEKDIEEEAELEEQHRADGLQGKRRSAAGAFAHVSTICGAVRQCDDACIQQPVFSRYQVF